MNVIDLLVTIVVVTILVTIVLAIVTYVAYKLRLSREPANLQGESDGLRYFVRHSPPDTDKASDTEATDRTAEAHATEA